MTGIHKSLELILNTACLHDHHHNEKYCDAGLIFNEVFLEKQTGRSGIDTHWESFRSGKG